MFDSFINDISNWSQTPYFWGFFAVFWFVIAPWLKSCYLSTPKNKQTEKPVPKTKSHKNK